MAPMFDCEPLPADLNLKGASFYSVFGIARNVLVGQKSGKEFIVFDWDTNAAELAQTFTVIGLEVSSPINPQTWLSRSSGLQLERVGAWVFAYQPGHRVEAGDRERAVADVASLVEYATSFPQNI